MALGSDLIDSATDIFTGSDSGTTLSQFLSRFGSSEGKYVDQINPLATFDVFIKFYPTIDSLQTPSTLDKLAQLGKTIATNAGNNLTGGLLGSLLNEGSTLEQAKKDAHIKNAQYINTKNTEKTKTFLEYLAKYNLLVGSENWLNSKQTTSPLELQLGFFIQSITVPKLKTPDGKSAETLFGNFPVNGQYVIPDNNVLQLDILCTKLPLHERIFYPWMREVTLPYWSYTTQPYTTATITIDFKKHTDMKYVFCGCRPTQIDTIQPTQEPNSSLTRQVTITFDTMYITSKNTVIESTISKLLTTGTTLLKSGSKMMNF